MGEKKWGCVKQAAVGCGCLVVAAIAIPMVLAAMIIAPMNRAVAARTELETSHGTQEAYVPPASGAPTTERIEAFLEVRRTLAATCEDFWDAEHAVANLEALDDQKERVSATVALKRAMSVMRPMMGMGPLIGHFFETRNQALVDAEMGLGEYSYIYVLAYRDEIENPSTKLQLFGPVVANRRVRQALTSMLHNQLDRVQQEGGSEEAIQLVAAEVEALENDSDRIPWQDGVPPEIAASLLPYREALDRAFCGSTPPFELMINEKRGLAIESR